MSLLYFHLCSNLRKSVLSYFQPADIQCAGIHRKRLLLTTLVLLYNKNTPAHFAVAKALIQSGCVLFLLLSHTHAYTHTQTYRLPMSGLPAACPRNGNQSKVTHAPNHQTPAAHLFYQKQILRSTLPSGNHEQENKLDWRSFLSDYFSRCCILP